MSIRPVCHIQLTCVAEHGTPLQVALQPKSRRLDQRWTNFSEFLALSILEDVNKQLTPLQLRIVELGTR